MTSEKDLNGPYHSRGPWIYDVDSNVVISENGSWVCQLWNRNEEDMPNHEANGPLLATAPEMLEVLEKAEEWLKGWASAEHELGMIQDVIAKAKDQD